MTSNLVKQKGHGLRITTGIRFPRNQYAPCFAWKRPCFEGFFSGSKMAVNWGSRNRGCFGKDAQVATTQCASGGPVHTVWVDMGNRNPFGFVGLKI